MTLVEVIVAMTIFAIMASAITGVMIRANTMTNRAKMRDTELAAETNIIGRNKSSTRDEIHAFDPPGYTGDFKIVFNEGSSMKTVDNVQVFQTNEGRFDDQFDFRLKTIIPSSSLNGLPLTNLADDEYLIKVTNDLSESVTISVEIDGGYLFEGNGQKYVHTTKSYIKTIPANTTADIGYYSPVAAEVRVVFETGITSASSLGLRASAQCRTTALDSNVRTIVYNVFSSGGTDPTFHVSQDIPTS